jgi:hypothetical protein
MAKNKYIPKSGQSPYRLFSSQKRLIEKHYNCFKCKASRNGLECIGSIKPDIDSVDYDVKIIYKYGKSPKVYILNPKIKISTKIHMYPEGYLCLYYPIEDPWRDYKNIHDTIIPWTAEWLVYYELYLVMGLWLGPEQTHLGQKKQ